MNVTFSRRRVEAIWRRARAARDLPLDGPEGWSQSNVDPMALLHVFSALRLKPGFILRAYRVRCGGNGNGIVYAMPEQAPFPEPEQCRKDVDHSREPPIPPQALARVMDAVEGDGTPWSFFSASLFAREVSEFGAMWHGESWHAHHIVASDPVSFIKRENARFSSKFEADAWTWEEPLPARWEPAVHEANSSISVVFHTYTALGQQRIVQHMDQYEPTTYEFRTTCRVLAYGPTGYIP